MNISTKLTMLCSVFAISVLGGCGGSSGGGTTAPPPPPPTGGITRNGFAIGSITTFGSVVVNGVRYSTDNATFTNDGELAAESDLSVGQVVFVQGTIDSSLATGTAESVISDDNVTGPVDSIDLAGNRLVVMGQPVIVNPDTSFDDNIDPASIEGLALGDIVEVSGFFTADGITAATRIEKKPAGTQLEVHGTVSSLDSANSTFSLNNLTVDYSNAMLNDFPGGQINDGDFVEAKGTAFGSNGELVAGIVELENISLGGSDGDHVEIEGFITRFVSETDFDVSGTPVTTDGSTSFVGGAATDLGLNIKVEVEGDLNASGVIVAEKVDIRRSKAVRVEALIDSVDAAAMSIVMLGITFNTDALTRFEDKSDADVEPLTISDLNVGEYLEVRGAEFPAGSGMVLATILEREDIDPQTSLQGFVEAVNDPTLTILGVTIETSGAVFRDVDGGSLDAAEFFAMVDINSLVKATGVESSATTITATEVEFELEN